MFSFDLSLKNGNLKSGSFGFSIKSLPIYVTVSTNDVRDVINSNIEVTNLDNKIDFDFLRSFLERDIFWSIDITSLHPILPHSGLGISTQIKTAVCFLCAKTAGVTLKKEDLFDKFNVGKRSGLGLQLFFNPGIIADFGYKKDDDGLLIHPELYQYRERIESYILPIEKLPCQAVIFYPKKHKSLSHELENDFWEDVFPDSGENSMEIIYEFFMNLLPGIEDQDRFLDSLRKITKIGTKPIEESIQNRNTKLLLKYVRSRNIFCSISSLGPTIYSFCKLDDDLNELSRIADKYGYNMIVEG